MNKTKPSRPRAKTSLKFPCFRPVPRTGVIYVMTEASKLGFHEDRAAWSNLGQGAPETSELEGAPPRITSYQVQLADLEYSPVVGLDQLRDAVANLYNHRYRRSHKSQYTRDNVAICSGGRLALTRLVSTLGKSNLGHFLPDYTAYEELLDSFGSFVPIPILLEEENHYSFSAQQLEREVLGRGLSAVLLSNPANPTGALIHGPELANWISVARALNCVTIFDEFYSHYVYDIDEPYVSAAADVEDVNSDPVVIFDGLTKNWRYPGFRVCWTLAPEEVIEAIASAGSFLDGGCARPMQLTSLSLLDPSIADREAAALRREFSAKREIMMRGLNKLGIRVHTPPQGTFYCWGDLSGLDKGLNSGTTLFERALAEKTIIVPGQFFDINPGQRRPDRASRFDHYARFSFGPSREEIELGLAGLARAIG